MTDVEYLKKLGEKKVSELLGDLLNECLEGANQDGSFKVVKVDLEKQKMVVEFDIAVYQPDKYVGFRGY